MLDEEQQAALSSHGVPAELRQGEATFHHPLVVHGSFANTSARQRRATVLNVMHGDVVSKCQGHDMGNFPRVPDGKPMGSHKCYPPLVTAEEAALMREAAQGVYNEPPLLDAAASARELAAMRARQERTDYRHVA